MKIESFNKNNLSEVRAQIQEKLNELKELGLIIELGNISYSDLTFTTKMTCALSSAGNKYSAEFMKKYMIHGMSKEHLGKTFMLNGQKHKFIGFKPGARTNIAIYENLANCQGYRTSVPQLLSYLGEQNEF